MAVWCFGHTTLVIFASFTAIARKTALFVIAVADGPLNMYIICAYLFPRSLYSINI